MGYKISDTDLTIQDIREEARQNLAKKGIHWTEDDVDKETMRLLKEKYHVKTPDELKHEEIHNYHDIIKQKHFKEIGQEIATANVDRQNRLFDKINEVFKNRLELIYDNKSSSSWYYNTHLKEGTRKDLLRRGLSEEDVNALDDAVYYGRFIPDEKRGRAIQAIIKLGKLKPSEDTGLITSRNYLFAEHILSQHGKVSSEPTPFLSTQPNTIEEYDKQSILNTPLEQFTLLGIKMDDLITSLNENTAATIENSNSEKGDTSGNSKVIPGADGFSI